MVRSRQRSFLRLALTLGVGFTLAFVAWVTQRPEPSEPVNAPRGNATDGLPPSFGEAPEDASIVDAHGRLARSIPPPLPTEAGDLADALTSDRLEELEQELEAARVAGDSARTTELERRLSELRSNAATIRQIAEQQEADL